MRRPKPTRRKTPNAASEDDKPIRIAVVGRPNTGKSTLINRLLGEERLLTGPEAGITRDAIAVDLDWHGKHFRIHDTPGMRRRARIEEKLEKLSVADALNAIRFAEVVIVLIDAQTPFEEQDIRIADLVEREGRAIVIARQQMGSGRARARRDVAAARGSRSDAAADQGRAGRGALGPHRRGPRPADGRRCVEAYAVWNRRVPTAALNRFLARAISAHPPPAVSGRALRLDYITQPKARPPTFVLFCFARRSAAGDLSPLSGQRPAREILICRARRSG